MAPAAPAAGAGGAGDAPPPPAQPTMTHLFKVVLIGDSGVGKSNLMLRYVQDEFIAEQKSTVGVEFLAKTLDIRGAHVKMQIWDTAGQERFRAISRSIYQGSEGVMLVYDITQRKTFDNLRRWLDDVRQHVVYGGAIIIVGNKTDLEDERTVPSADAQQYAEAEGLCYMETSALQASNVDDAFEWLAAHILSAKIEVLRQIEADGPGSSSYIPSTLARRASRLRGEGRPVYLGGGAIEAVEATAPATRRACSC